MVFVYNDVCFTSVHYSLNNSIQEKSNNPDVLAAGPLKTPRRTARSTSCSQWTGMMSSHDYSCVYNEKRNYM